MKNKSFTRNELEDGLNALPVSDRSKKTLANFFRHRKEPIFFGYLILYSGFLLFFLSAWILYAVHGMDPSAKQTGLRSSSLAFWIGLFFMSIGRSYIDRVNVRRAVIEIIMGERTKSSVSPESPDSIECP
jgi:hypothetical protein